MEQIFKSLDEMKIAFSKLEKTYPYVYASAAITLDGKLSSKRTPLGGASDKEWYGYLASQADDIIVGAKTFRGSGNSENTKYKGRSINVLSNSLDLPLDAPAITGSEKFTVYTTKDPVQKRVELIQQAGKNNSVRKVSSAREVLDGKTGNILIDGGGEIYTLFAPLIDNWFLTLVPRFGPNDKTSIWTKDFDGPELDPVWVFPIESRLICRFKKLKYLSNEEK